MENQTQELEIIEDNLSPQEIAFNKLSNYEKCVLLNSDGLPQSAIAERVGISQQAVSQHVTKWRNSMLNPKFLSQVQSDIGLMAASAIFKSWERFLVTYPSAKPLELAKSAQIWAGIWESVHAMFPSKLNQKDVVLNDMERIMYGLDDANGMVSTSEHGADEGNSGD